MWKNACHEKHLGKHIMLRGRRCEVKILSSPLCNISILQVCDDDVMRMLMGREKLVGGKSNESHRRNDYRGPSGSTVYK